MRDGYVRPMTGASCLPAALIRTRGAIGMSCWSLISLVIYQVFFGLWHFYQNQNSRTSVKLRDRVNSGAVRTVYEFAWC